MPVIICGGVVLVLIAVVLAILLIPNETTTTMQSSRPSAAKDCVLWGDPHAKSFDGSFPNVYDQGEYWVLRSAQVSIQGRFMATPFTNGLAATHQIAVGGDAVGGHVLNIGPMDNGQITCDNQVILTGFPSQASCGGAFVQYNSDGALVDEAQANLDKKIVHVSFPVGSSTVKLQIMRWANHLNVKVSLVGWPGDSPVDGICGNANGNPSDDTTDAIMARLGGRVDENSLLFRQRARMSNAPHKTIADCEMNKREKAMKECKEAQPSAQGELLDTCIFDVCFGGDQYAAEDGLAEGEALQR